MNDFANLFAIFILWIISWIKEQMRFNQAHMNMIRKKINNILNVSQSTINTFWKFMEILVGLQVCFLTVNFSLKQSQISRHFFSIKGLSFLQNDPNFIIRTTQAINLLLNAFLSVLNPFFSLCNFFSKNFFTSLLDSFWKLRFLLIYVENIIFSGVFYRIVNLVVKITEVLILSLQVVRE